MTDKQLLIDCMKLLGRYDDTKEGVEPEEGETLTYEKIAEKYPWGDWKIGNHPDIRFKPHQLVGKFPSVFAPREKSLRFLGHEMRNTDRKIDAKIMHTLERSPIRGWMCQSAVGIGKTITYLLSILLEVCMLREELAAGKPIIARPTLISMPSGLTPQTVNQALEHFGHVLKIHSFYGTKANISDAESSRKEATVSQLELDSMMREWAKNTHDPETAAHVVITSNHNFEEVAKGYRGPGGQEHGIPFLES